MYNRIRALALGLVLSVPTTHATTPEDHFTQGWQHYQAREFTVAFQQWGVAARDGYPTAQLNLGMLYEFGQGVTQDTALAAHWYARAARQGLSAAQANLGALYANGEGVPLDAAASVHWYRAAADQGLAFAQYQLGMLYAQGKGVRADLASARIWLRKSAAQGEPAAVQALLTLATPAPASWSTSWEDASTGSGWPVSRGLVVTNYHVVEGSREILLIDTLGREIAAEVMLSNRTDDLALLRVADPDALPPTLPLAAADAAPGGSVFALGYPRIDVLGHSPKLSSGEVSRDLEPGGDRRAYRLDLHIEPGYSGGPLFNSRGEVVGTITGMLGAVDSETGETRLLPNASVAVKLSAIKAMLRRLSTNSAPPGHVVNAAGRAPADVERIGTSVLVVVAR